MSGTRFAVWAPNASRVSVVGDFNHWDGRCHGMRLRRECGVWEIFLPGVRSGARYKYEIRDQDGRVVARERVWAQAHRTLARLNGKAQQGQESAP